MKCKECVHFNYLGGGCVFIGNTSREAEACKIFHKISDDENKRRNNVLKSNTHSR